MVVCPQGLDTQAEEESVDFFVIVAVNYAHVLLVFKLNESGANLDTCSLASQLENDVAE